MAFESVAVLLLGREQYKGKKKKKSMLWSERTSLCCKSAYRLPRNYLQRQKARRHWGCIWIQCSVVLLLYHENSLIKAPRAFQMEHGFKAGAYSMKPPGLFFLLLETENGPLGSVQDEHFWIFSKAHLNMAAFPLTIYFSKKQLSKSCYEHGKIQLNTVIKRLLQLKLLSLDKIMQWVYRMFSMMLIGVNLGASFICVQKSFNTCSCRRTSP